MDYPIPEPLPEPLPDGPCVIQITILDFFLLWIGAGIGYFMIGHCGANLCCKPPSPPQQPNQVILARSLSS